MYQFNFKEILLFPTTFNNGKKAKFSIYLYIFLHILQRLSRNRKKVKIFPRLFLAKGKTMQ